jgi:hypothetical protein
MTTSRTVAGRLLLVVAMLALLLVPGVAMSATGPDLTATKTNDVNGSVRIGEPWHWTVHVANVGDAAADFAVGDTILLDQVPENLLISYGQLHVVNSSGITGTIGCGSISSGPLPRGFVCRPDDEPVSIAAGGSFDLTFSASSSADHVYPNPVPAGFFSDIAPAGRCAVDPSARVAESNEGNNNCSDTVTVATEALSATKSNNVSFSTTLGESWIWTIDIDNHGNRSATFASGDRILIDSLPDQNISYGAVTVATTGGVTGSVACAIDAAFNLLCSAAGGAVSLPPGSSILVSVTATPSATGEFANPRSGGVCFVDPDFVVPENHAGNHCSDTVTVGSPDLSVTKTNTTNGNINVGGHWFWHINIVNEGNANAVFDAGEVIFIDDLPADDIVYGPLQYSAGPNFVCTVTPGAQIRCEASGGPVVIGTSPAGTSIIFTATPSAGRVFANPRSGGICTVDPGGAVGENDETNNECQDTVTAFSPTSTELSCVPSTVNVGSPSGCTATVNDTSASPSTPTGSAFFDSGGGGTFSATTCSLVPIASGRASCSVSFTPNLVGDRIVRAVYSGDEIHRQSASPLTHITAVNTPPEVILSGPNAADEGDTNHYTYDTTDADSSSFTRSLDCGANGTVVLVSDVFDATTGDGSFSCSFPEDNPTATSSDPSTVGVTVHDDGGASDSASIIVTVGNLAPVITGVTGPVHPVAMTLPATVIASFTDAGSQDAHACSFDWHDGTGTSIGVVSESNGSGTCTGTHNYLAPGVHTVETTVSDDDGGSATAAFQYVVVYDTDSGFVTGGGWIQSPSGAYTPDDTTDADVTGKANFGFVSKYKRGLTVPEGNTEFQFHAGNLKFRSTEYDWLVIAGPKAQYKGWGTINGGGNYRFLLTANDGQVNGGGGVDRFRIKIWDPENHIVVYDNQGSTDEFADATDAIEGGSITIHKT